MNMAAKQRFIRGGGWMALCVLACGLASAVPSARAQKESAAAPSAEAGAWVEVQTPHFVVASDAGEAAARGGATDFEQIRVLSHATFRELRVDPPQPIRIVVT